MSGKPSKILFIVSFSFDKVIGGHLLSAIGIAKRLVNKGYKVEILTDIPENQLHDLQESGIIVNHYPWKLNSDLIVRRIIEHIKRIIYLIRLSRNYDVLILMDYYATLHTGIAILKSDILPIQVIPGGKAFFPPINFPGIIIFSDELKQDLNKLYKIKNEYLLVSYGQIDFAEYETLSKNSSQIHNLEFTPNIVKLLTASRLVPFKEKALINLLNEVEEIGMKQSIQLVIIGDGESKEIIEGRANEVIRNTQGNAIIKFPGGFRVHPTDLMQADLVVGQGRTVMEALACGVPASVCGNDGYKGLITVDTLPILAPTNLTGRRISINKKLIDDIELLDYHKLHGVKIVQQMAKNFYDADLGVKVVEQAWNQIQEKYPKLSIRKLNYLINYVKIIFYWVVESMNYRIRNMNNA